MERTVAGSLSRRRFARAAVGMLAGAIVTVPRSSDATITVALDGVIHCRASAARIGRRYLASLPVRIDRVGLLKMNPELESILRAASDGRDGATPLLRRCIADDFRREDTVVIDGWVLAATEAQFCALIALG